MGGRGAGTGSLGSASKWTDEDLGIGGIMDDADGSITERQLEAIRDLQRKLQEYTGPEPGRGLPGVHPDPAAPRKQHAEGNERELAERAAERSRRLRAINPERMSRRGASRFTDAV